MPRRVANNAATILDPATLPSSLVGVHFAGPDLTASQLLMGRDAPAATAVQPAGAGETTAPTAWTVEVVYTSDERFDTPVSEELLDKIDRGFRIILRVDYERKQPVPAADDTEAVQRYVNTFLRFYELTHGRVRYFVIGNEGNLDTPGDDPSRTTECLAGRSACSPWSYVQVYRQVRWALRSRTDAYLLVGPPSPGSTKDPARWIDGAAYLRAILDLLHPLEVDGVALHAYGGQDGYQVPGARPIDHFAYQLDGQIQAVTEAGLLTTPLFITEMNAFAAPDPGFVRETFRWIDDHNRRSAQDIVAACWFVYHDETGQWSSLALENQPEALTALRDGAALPPGR
jgi:hypothetical protein